MGLERDSTVIHGTLCGDRVTRRNRACGARGLRTVDLWTKATALVAVSLVEAPEPVCMPFAPLVRICVQLRFC